MKLVLVNLKECSYCEELEKLLEPVNPVLVDIDKPEDREWLRAMHSAKKLYEVPQVFVLINGNNNDEETEIKEKEKGKMESLIH